MRGTRRAIGAALALGVLAGCRSPRPAVAAAEPPAPHLAEVVRDIPAPDVSAIALAVPADPPAVPARYLRLTADECRRAACGHAVLARGILAAADDGADGVQSHRQAAVEALRQRVAHALAREARGRAAAGALELYYKLQQAELLADLLDRSLAETDALVSAADKLAAGGFAEAPEAFALRRSQLDLRAERVTITAGIRRLNDELKPLLGLPPDDARLLPVDGVRVAPDTLDLGAAYALASQSRGDFQAVRALQTSLDRQTVDAVRQAVAGLLPPLGAITAAANTLAPGLRVLLPFLRRPDVDGVRRQLAVLQQSREEELFRDLSAAVNDFHAQRDRLAVSRRRVEFEATRVAELDVRRSKGLPVEADWRRARLALLSAERQQLTDAYAWQQADVTVRKLLGNLCDGPECGPCCP
jgi:hypothetical protein